ncbi:ABC-type bacteriocin/lantibiotic exporter with double-glycine peptidase domain [Paenibacillus forsythiae]|uniref:ABC-type bacteriocin/lantibiotic exporter with double-glycine peptidase domain n=1 Tax=Paenibacillus forsythiae TaxID=365616 RepID=A0ABU3HDC9_9BACL|nr:ABC transporter ATP-binding protein [Paenibacillus forsythiae]MDT3428819.1 ABC-type bacteriocin/lantibiotic exporter with double-glycine peptidase domain [Paenibacillus forsythiae]
MRKPRQLLNTDVYRWLKQCMTGKWGALSVIILLNVILSLSGAVLAIVSKQVIDSAVQNSMRVSGIYATLFALILILQLALSSLLTLRTVKLREAMNNDLQQSFMDRLYKTEWNAAGKYHSGDLLTHLTSDIANITDGLVNTLPSILSLVAQFAAAFITLLYFDKTLALFAFLLGPVSMLVSWYIGSRLKRMQHQIQSAESRYRSLLHECVQNLLIVKTFEHEQDSLHKVQASQANRLFWILKRTRFNVAADLTMGIGYRLGFFLAFIWGAYRISTGAASFGMFTAFLQLVGQIQGPLEGLARTFPVLIAMIASSERLIVFQKLQSEDRSKDMHERLPAALSGISGLQMEHVGYGYEAGKPILTDVSLSIRPGELIALIGTSGEGKTTLLRLLLALIKPQAGNVCLIGPHHERISLSADTRSYFSYVPQGNTLFSGTIADNLRIGHPAATEEEINAALEAACARSFTQKLPHGIHTVIGEHGSGLSEGQAQRIAIARALLRPAPILLLDEATSALDMDTEWAVLQNIRNLKPARTCIAITHRLSVFDVCDHIYRLSKGQLLEQKKELVTLSE